MSNRQRGVALITVMLISAIAAIIATKTTVNSIRTVSRTASFVGSDQGLLYVYSIEEWVKHALAKDARESSADFPGEDWSVQVPALPIEGGFVSGGLKAANGRYNVNNLLDDKGNIIAVELERLARLINLLELPPALVDTIADWLDADSSVRRSGAEDIAYESLDPPYRAANQGLTDISELRLIAGISPKAYEKLKQHLVALPLRTPVNANFASAITLRMLDQAITPDVVRDILPRQNKKQAFRDHGSLIQTMQAASTDKNLIKRLPATLIGVKSQFFILNVSVTYNETSLSAVSIIQRKDAGQVRVVYRLFGAWATDF